MLQRGLDQQTDQIMVVKDGTARDDRAGDLDLVQSHDVDQGRRGPIGVRQSLRKAMTYVALGLDDQGHEDRVEQGLDVGMGRLALGAARLAQVDDPGEQTLSVTRSRLRASVISVEISTAEMARLLESEGVTRMTLRRPNENMLKDGVWRRGESRPAAALAREDAEWRKT